MMQYLDETVSQRGRLEDTSVEKNGLWWSGDVPSVPRPCREMSTQKRS
jgi:hypothetical protein